MSCSYSILKSRSNGPFPVDLCSYVQEQCSDANSMDFFSLRYCQLDRYASLFYCLAILAILWGFYALSNISDRHLSTGLSLLAKRLKLTEALAGVTVLAFANGAPDIVASFSAGAEEGAGVFISVGSLFGACLFAATIVLGACILFSKTDVIVSSCSMVSWRKDPGSGISYSTLYQVL